MSSETSEVIPDSSCNPNRYPQSSSIPTETNPAGMDIKPKKDETNCNTVAPISHSSTLPQSSSLEEYATQENNHSSSSKEDPSKHQEDEYNQKNDCPSFSTAFTISFEDDSSATKKLGIKDSIRKFAPPKPHTIEKPRQPKSEQNQDSSLMSIESAPGGLSRHSARKDNNTSRQSNSSRHSSSRHSNISESAAFLIEKMLNCKTNDDETSSTTNKSTKSSSSQTKRINKPINRMAHSSDDMVLDSEIDFCEDKSDNGTYIVGTDPESEAARKKIDELFGVVKAAEASVLADAAMKISSTHQSRATEKKTMSRERQERYDRLSKRHPSRSSSSSRQDNVCSQDRQPRASSRHSRNSSCDRESRPTGSRPKRSASQSSRHSSQREVSDGDTRSSRSSLHNGAERFTQDNLANNPSMKFNRAFALRRARLGLGDPTRVPVPPILTSNTNSELEQQMSSLTTSQRRQPINTNTYRAGQMSSGSANFCREDGGRFSLRMKNSVLPNRLNSRPSNRAPQTSAIIESYMNRVSTTKAAGNTNHQGPSGQQYETGGQSRNLPKNSHPPQNSTSSITMPYQSGDELEPMSPSRYRVLSGKALRMQKRSPIELLDNDNDSIGNSSRLNYSLGLECSDSGFNDSGRAMSSTGRRGGSSMQLGALDSLVISAISGLSLKIRQSVCDVLVEHAKKLPVGNETRLIVEEILPQLMADSNQSKSPTSMEEIDQSLYFDLAKTLKNLKKVEQMVDVISLISGQLSNSAIPNSQVASNSSPTTSGNLNSITNNLAFKVINSSQALNSNNMASSHSTTPSEVNSTHNLSPI